MQVKNHTNVCMTIHLHISHKNNNINSMKYVHNARLMRKRKNVIVET